MNEQGKVKVAQIMCFLCNWNFISHILQPKQIWKITSEMKKKSIKFIGVFGNRFRIIGPTVMEDTWGGGQQLS